MDTLLKTTAAEINNSLIDFIKKSFEGKKIAVHIYEMEEDDTEFLLSNPTTKKRLLESIGNVNSNNNLKEYSIADIENFLNDAGE
ncbi:MAG: hypothetical protein ABIY51_06500 [Ferruginibacter sp.]